MGKSVFLDDVSFSYDGTLRQLDRLTLDIKAGEVVVITGPSGSGKSTVTRVINGLAPRFYRGELSGRVSIDGADVGNLPSWELSKLVGNVFQDPRSQFFSNEVAGEIAFGCENLGFSHSRIIEAVDKASRDTGMEDLLEETLHNLSYGMRQKVAIASAYAMDPDVYAMDEPSANLDREASLRLADNIRRLKEQGKIVIIAEHRLLYPSGIADRFILIEQGKAVRDISAAEMSLMLPAEAESPGLRLANLALLGKSNASGDVAHMAGGGVSPADSVSRAAPVSSAPAIPSRGAPALLEVEGLSKAFGRTTVANDVEFSCSAGEVLAIVGPNGAGKSSCAKMLAGLLKEDSGRVLLDGRPLACRRRVGRIWYVPQDLDSQLFGEDLVDELTTGLPDAGSAKDRAREMLCQLGLEELEGRHPSTLSGGQKQRLVLGVALFRGAPAIILDEPTSGLDGASMRRVARIVREIAAQGKAVIIITHDVEFVASCCDRVIRLEQGAVLDDFERDEPSRLLSAMGYVETLPVGAEDRRRSFMEKNANEVAGGGFKGAKNPFGLLLAWSEENRKWYVPSALLAVIGVAGGIVPYFAAGAMVNGILTGMADIGFYAFWCGVAAIGYLFLIAFRTASTALSHRATFSTMSKIRRRIADHLSKVPLGYVVETPSGKLKNIMVEKVDSIEASLAHVIPEMSSNLIIPFAVIIFMFALDWRMALVSLVTLPIGALCYMGMMRNYEARYGEQVTAGEAMSAVAVEYVNGIEVIKAFGQSASSYEKYSKAVKRAARSSIDWMASVEVYQDAALAIWPSTLVTVLPVGCMFVLQGTLDPAVFVLIAILSLGIFPSLYAAASFSDSLAQIGTIVGQIDEVLSQAAQRRGEVAGGLGDGHIDIRKVHFSYGDEEVLHGIDLSIEPGQVAAFVGPSGSGKSTLAGLIAGFWDVDSGSVEIGGVSINDMTSEQAAAHITYVTQDTYLFDDTIMNNIRQGRPGATDEEVVAIAKASGCDELIRSLEQGYETRVGGSGGHLSGGERQRISIARAMLKDAPIVILDEATANVDPENERDLQRAIESLTAKKTVITIAHRLNTVRNADQIIVLDRGRLVQRGTHRDLMQQPGIYADFIGMRKNAIGWKVSR